MHVGVSYLNTASILPRHVWHDLYISALQLPLERSSGGIARAKT